jgi:hypothetical protein
MFRPLFTQEQELSPKLNINTKTHDLPIKNAFLDAVPTVPLRIKENLSHSLPLTYNTASFILKEVVFKSMNFKALD